MSRRARAARLTKSRGSRLDKREKSAGPRIDKRRIRLGPDRAARMRIILITIRIWTNFCAAPKAAPK